MRHPFERQAAQHGITDIAHVHVRPELVAPDGQEGLGAEHGVSVPAGIGVLLRSELDTPPVRFRFVDVLGQERAIDVPAGCLAFTYCQVPVVIRAGIAPSIELEGADGPTTTVAGTRLGREASAAVFSRGGTYRRLTVTVRMELLHPA